MVGAMMMQPLKTVKGVSAVAVGQLLKTVFNLNGEQPFDDPLGIINDETGVLLGNDLPLGDVFRPGILTPHRVRFRIGDGSTSTESTHKGTVDFIQCGKMVAIIDVLLLASCPYMLISEHQLDAKGCSITKANGRAEVKLGSETILAGAYNHLDNMCHVDCKFVHGVPRARSNMRDQN